MQFRVKRGKFKVNMGKLISALHCFSTLMEGLKCLHQVVNGGGWEPAALRGQRFGSQSGARNWLEIPASKKLLLDPYTPEGVSLLH